MGGSSLKPTQTSSVLGFYFLGSKSPADPEHVAIRMAKVHPADVPRHIGGRKCDLQPGGHALLVHLVHATSRRPCRPLHLRSAETWWCSRRGLGLPAPPDKERCKFPYPIQPRQRSEAFPSPTICSIPTFQTTRPRWRCRTRSISGILRRSPTGPRFASRHCISLPSGTGL
jgi:hypothetical protein